MRYNDVLNKIFAVKSTTILNLNKEIIDAL